MHRSPFIRRALLRATVGCAAALAVVSVPAAAWADSPDPSACAGLYHGSPPGSLAITTTPPAGSVLHPGDDVDVTATWNTADWPRPVLHKVLDCLLVDGTVDYSHSSQEKPTDNDGLYRYRFTVPTGTEGRICDRVRLSGRIVDGGDLVVQKSNTVCFSVAAAGRAGPPGGPPAATTQAATVVENGAPAPLQPAATPAPADDAAPPAATPAPPDELSAAVAVHPTLPVTGADVLPLAGLGALLTILGGAALGAGKWEVSRIRPGP